MKYLIPFLFFVGFAYGQPPCFPSITLNHAFINHFEFNSLLNANSQENGDYTVIVLVVIQLRLVWEKPTPCRLPAHIYLALITGSLFG